MEYRSVLAKTSPRLQPAPVSLLPPRALRPSTAGWLAHKGASGSGPYHRVAGRAIASCSFTSARGRQLKVFAAPMSAPEALTSSDGSEGLQVVFDNTGDEECTVITVEGKDQSHLLMSLTGVFSTTGLSVVSASIQSDDGRVLDVFRVTTADGKKVPETKFDEVRKQIIDMTSGSSRSNKPAIYGIVAAAEVERLRPLSASADQNDVQNLELTAAEMAQAAADLVAREREILSLRTKGADSSRIHAKESARAEAAAALERKMAAMEALLAARRALALVEPEKDKKKDVSAFIEQMKPAVAARASSGPGCGNGYEILLQAFNWESHRHKFYKTLQGQISSIAKAGFTAVWLPPPSDSVSPQGYLPRDLYQLDSAYGTESELRELISTCHDNNIKVIADIVINHRCANFQGSDGKWNKFGGRLAWDSSAICCNNPAFGGRGAPKSGDDYAAAPNIDHSQERIRQDITGWLKYLRTSIGFDGWRLDFVRGYQGSYVKQYVDETVPEMAFGEYWDACEYTDGVLNYNQDAHRQRTINWCDSTGGTSAAFDFTTKGVLQEAVSRREYWRLVDSQGRPPGVMGMWPSRAITFVDNHDTGSTLNHWPFPANHIHEGYAYILTHPGTPTVFCDHLWQEQGGLRKTVLELTALRKKHGINCRTKCSIKKATNDVYAAVLDDKIAMKIGHGDWSPNSANIKPNGKPMKLAASGPNFAVWEVDS